MSYLNHRVTKGNISFLRSVYEGKNEEGNRKIKKEQNQYKVRLSFGYGQNSCGWQIHLKLGTHTFIYHPTDLTNLALRLASQDHTWPLFLLLIKK